MLNLIADYPMFRILLLAALFGIVVVVSFYAATAATTRQLARKRLNPDGQPSEVPLRIGSLRSDKIESAWLTLVNGIEKAGLSLTDTKDPALRQRLIAAGSPPRTRRESIRWCARLWYLPCRFWCLACSGC